MNVKWIDFTIWSPDVETDGRFRDLLTPLFTKWAYGIELAPTTNRRHMQCRGMLRAPLGPELVSSLSHAGVCHISPTHVRDFEYIYKDGLFYESWDRPRQCYLDAELQDWQLTLMEREHDDRSIEIVFDPSGGAGKTFFGRCMEAKHLAVYVPPVMRAVDISACALARRFSDWYILDCPFAYDFSREFWVGVENLKNGLIYDTRYKWDCHDIGLNPRVTLLCNGLPSPIPLSPDRVDVLEIYKEPTTNEDSLRLRRDLGPALQYEVIDYGVQ